MSPAGESDVGAAGQRGWRAEEPGPSGLGPTRRQAGGRFRVEGGGVVMARAAARSGPRRLAARAAVGQDLEPGAGPLSEPGRGIGGWWRRRPGEAPWPASGSGEGEGSTRRRPDQGVEFGDGGSTETAKRGGGRAELASSSTASGGGRGGPSQMGTMGGGDAWPSSSNSVVALSRTGGGAGRSRASAEGTRRGRSTGLAGSSLENRREGGGEEPGGGGGGAGALGQGACIGDRARPMVLRLQLAGE